MKIKTKHFGDLEIEQKDIFRFESGLPGFENEKQFVYIRNSDEECPFNWLQSTSNMDLAFVVVSPFDVIPEYSVDIPDEELQNLKINDIAELLLICIVVIPENIKNTSVNLKAPIVINATFNIAKQITLATDYSIRHYIFEQKDRG